MQAFTNRTKNYSQRGERESMRRTVGIRCEQQRHTVDLDELVEQWVWHMWNVSRTKSMSQYKREDLLVTINWKHVLFTQNEAHFAGAPPIRTPRSQTLFRTNFTNKTTNEHSYAFKTERLTRSTFKFIFTQSLCKSQESAVVFRLPEQIVEVGGGIRREQHVTFGQDTTKEHEMRWSVDSQVRVPPQTRAHGELNITEEEFHGDFSVSIQFSGRINATIASRQSPNTYLKFFDGDIVHIVREAIENGAFSGMFDIVEENSPFVRFTMRGKCAFRYGIEQHILLNQEPLEPLLIRPASITRPGLSFFQPTLPEYHRPLRAHLANTSGINVHLDNRES